MSEKERRDEIEDVSTQAWRAALLFQAVATGRKPGEIQDSQLARMQITTVLSSVSGSQFLVKKDMHTTSLYCSDNAVTGKQVSQMCIRCVTRPHIGPINKRHTNAMQTPKHHCR